MIDMNILRVILSTFASLSAGSAKNLLFAVASGGLHVYLSYAGYYSWNMTQPVGIDGGPLGSAYGLLKLD